MNISPSTNTQILNTIAQNKTESDTALEKIAAARRLSGKDGADLMASDALASQISGLSQTVQNANDTIGMYQIADSSLQALSAGSDKLNELSTRYNSDVLSNDQKASLQKEFDSISKSMQDIASQTTYNGQKILSSSYGLDVSSVNNLNINDQQSITDFSKSLTSFSATVSSRINGAVSEINNALSGRVNLEEARSQVSETPLDKSVSDQKSNDIKLTSSILAQVHQTNMMQQNISALLA